MRLLWPASFADSAAAPPAPAMALSVEAYAAAFESLHAELPALAARLAGLDRACAVPARRGQPDAGHGLRRHRRRHGPGGRRRRAGGRRALPLARRSRLRARGARSGSSGEPRGIRVTVPLREIGADHSAPPPTARATAVSPTGSGRAGDALGEAQCGSRSSRGTWRTTARRRRPRARRRRAAACRRPRPCAAGSGRCADRCARGRCRSRRPTGPLGQTRVR